MSINDSFYRNERSGSFANAVALGEAEGYQSLFLFGRNPDIDSAQEEHFVAWGTYQFQPTAGPMYLSSTNSGDVGLVYVVLALDENLLPVTCVGTTNGQGGSQLIGPEGQTDFLRANTMFNVTPAGTASVGDIYLGMESAPVGGIPSDANKVLLAGAEEQQSSQAVFTIPANATGLLSALVITTNRNSNGGNSDVYLNTRNLLTGGPSRRRTEAGVQVSGSSIVQYNLEYPVNLGSGTDVSLSAEASVNNTSLAGGFQLLLVDN
ncbi:MAG: hypothetical protein Unbinned96contig1001_24 [Prokaryotic dsDNA virus sp.]|nr:MAG: hypothetical protein Unbinned96contig1001_24 [Prokaryotic dsDNA virus sp.]|tara:strand:- start:13003 stop:13794 length:792 start_codon:yes stop_codon:yes gene_type:complete